MLFSKKTQKPLVQVRAQSIEEKKKKKKGRRRELEIKEFEIKERVRNKINYSEAGARKCLPAQGMTHPAKTYQERSNLPGSLSLWDFRSAAQPTHNMRMRAENPGNIHEAMSAKFPARSRDWLMMGFSGMEISF